MYHLRIVDTTPSDSHDCTVQISLESADSRRSFTVSGLDSSSLHSLQADLAWYFRDYLVSNEPDDRRVIDRLLQHGKALADQMMGDDLELMSYKDLIEEVGYGGLKVSIESSRVGFFEEFWESLVLPESKYVLASAASAFVRRLTNASSAASHATDHATPVRCHCGPDVPLQLLYLQHQASNGLPGTTHNAYEMANGLMQFDGAVRFRQDSLQGPLKSFSIAHVVHLDAELGYQDQALYVELESDNDSGTRQTTQISLGELCRSLKSAGCELLILDIDIRQPESGEPLSDQLGLALAAHAALQAGIPNIIGFASPTDCWSSSSCLEPLMRGLVDGLTIAQAVVEARKFLQTNLADIPLGVKPAAFHRWPLLIHFEHHPVAFFDAPQAAKEILQTEEYGRIRKGLYGFHAERLPPLMKVCSDSVLASCLAACHANPGELILLRGGPGMGKTQLLHMLAFDAVRSAFAAAFYFDYREHEFSVEDIGQMVEPIVTRSREENGSSQDNARFLFVLDNLDEVVDLTRRNQLVQYLHKLVVQGHVVVGSSAAALSFFDGAEDALRIIEIPAWGSQECQRLARMMLAEDALKAPNLTAMLNSILPLARGNPFLVTRMLRIHSVHPKLLAPGDLDKVLNENVENPVQSFRDWEWAGFSPERRRWLKLLSGSRGLVLEMLAVVMDARERPEAASRLKSLIGLPSSGFSTEIQELRRLGWAVAFPAGTTLTADSMALIRSLPELEPQSSDQAEQVDTLFSRVICQALALIIPQILKKRDEIIIQHLLSNRWQWARHLARAWHEGYQAEFSRAAYPLVELLRQSNLSEEASAWALSLLGASHTPTIETSAGPALTSDLVKLATLALPSKGSEGTGALEAIVVLCNDWLARPGVNNEDIDPALFSSVAQFLQSFYSKVENYPELERVSRIAYRTYSDNEVWPLAIPALERLIDCCFRNGKAIEGKELENHLLNGTPLEHFPSGFRWHLTVRTVTKRIQRKDLEAASQLLQSLQNEKQMSDQQHELLTLLEADICYAQEEFERASVIYEQLRSSALIQADGPRLAMVEKRCAELREQLSASTERY